MVDGQDTAISAASTLANAAAPGFVRNELSNRYGMDIPPYLNQAQGQGACRCNCPTTEPRWDIRERGTNLPNPDPCKRTFCCKEGFRVQFASQRFNTRGDRCFEIEADDEWDM